MPLSAQGTGCISGRPVYATKLLTCCSEGELKCVGSEKLPKLEQRFKHLSPQLLWQNVIHYIFSCIYLVCNSEIISTDWNEKQVSKNTISFWLREVIKRAYQSSEGEDSLPQYRVHEVGGLAPTLLSTRNFTVDQMLKAGAWRSQTTFTSFYLWDANNDDDNNLGFILITMELPSFQKRNSQALLNKQITHMLTHKSTHYSL